MTRIETPTNQPTIDTEAPASPPLNEQDARVSEASRQVLEEITDTFAAISEYLSNEPQWDCVIKMMAVSHGLDIDQELAEDSISRQRLQAASNICLHSLLDRIEVGEEHPHPAAQVEALLGNQTLVRSIFMPALVDQMVSGTGYGSLGDREMEILRRLGQWEIYTLRSMQEDLEPGASEVLATTDEEQTTKSAYLFYSMSGRLNEALAAFDAISNCVSEAEYVRISEKIRYLAYAESTAVLKEAGAMLGTSADPAHASRPARELLADIEEVLAELPSVDTRQSFRRWLSILLQQMAEFLTLMDLG